MVNFLILKMLIYETILNKENSKDWLKRIYDKKKIQESQSVTYNCDIIRFWSLLHKRPIQLYNHKLIFYQMIEEINDNLRLIDVTLKGRCLERTSHRQNVAKLIKTLSESIANS